MPSLDQLIVWLIVGLIGGTLAGFATKWDRKGYGILRNLLVGLVGAIVGGFLIRAFGLWPSLDAVAISRGTLSLRSSGPSCARDPLDMAALQESRAGSLAGRTVQHGASDRCMRWPQQANVSASRHTGRHRSGGERPEPARPAPSDVNWDRPGRTTLQKG